jgi:hypothetical protein
MLNAAAGDAHPNEFRAFLRGMDALCQISAKSKTTAAQPSSPTNGDTYILPSGATGTAWGGKAAGTIAYFTTQQTTTSSGTENTVSGWDFITPKRGFYANVEDEGDACYRYDGSAWQVFYKEGTWTPTPTNLTGTGIAYSTKYVQNGSKADFAITITGTGLQSTINSTRLSLPFTNGRISIASADNGSNAGGICEVSGGTVYLPTMGPTTQINVSGSIYTN